MASRSPATPHTTNLLIEGWRGLNHSFGLVNQYQILEFLQIPYLRLSHHDLPFFHNGWSRERNSSNFPLEMQALIDSIPPLNEEKVDCVYRASFPFLCGNASDHRRTITFMVTEFGLTPTSFANADGDGNPPDLSFLTRGSNLIVTPSMWARDRVIEYGFPADHVRVVPHGVDQRTVMAIFAQSFLWRILVNFF